MKCPKCGTEFFGDKCPVCGYEPTEYDRAIETLMSLTGVGRKRAEELYKAGFTSIDKILESSEDELTRVRGIGRELARRIKEDAEKIVVEERPSLEIEEEEETTGITICPVCGAVVPANLDKCPRCGAPLTHKDISAEKKPEEELKERVSPAGEGELSIGDVVVCPNCGALVPKGSFSCPVCGADLRNVELREPKPMEDPTEVLKRVFGISSLPTEGVKEVEQEVDIRVCPNCGALVVNRDTCPICGAQVPKVEARPIEEEIDLSEKLRVCPNCGAFVSPSAKVCPVCGLNLPEEKEEAEEEIGITLAELRSMITPMENTVVKASTDEIGVEDLQEIENTVGELSEAPVQNPPIAQTEKPIEFQVDEGALDEILTSLEEEREIGLEELEEIGKTFEGLQGKKSEKKVKMEKEVEEKKFPTIKEERLGFIERLNDMLSTFGTRQDMLSFSPLFTSLVYFLSVGFLSPIQSRILYFSTGFFMALLAVLGSVEAYISGKTWNRISHILGFAGMFPVIVFIHPFYTLYIVTIFFVIWSYIHMKYTVNYWVVIASYSVLFIVFPEQTESILVALAFTFGMHLIWRLSEGSMIAYEEIKGAEDIYSDGIRAFMEKRYYDAIYLLKKSLELKPDDKLALNTLGLAYARIGNDDMALETFRKIISLDPKYKYAWNNMGNVYARMGDYDKAIECYRRALKIDPDYSDALLNLGYVMIRMGSYREAVKLAEKIKAIS